MKFPIASLSSHELAKLILAQPDMPVEIYCTPIRMWYGAGYLKVTENTVEITTED